MIAAMTSNSISVWLARAMKKCLWPVLCATMFLQHPAPAASAPAASIAAHVPTELATTAIAARWADVVAFYRDRENEPLWFRDGTLTDVARAVIAQLGHADQEGLEPSHFQAAELAAKVKDDVRFDPAVEAAITGQLLHYLYDVRHGRLVAPGAAEPDTYYASTPFSVTATLETLAKADDVTVVMRDAVPANAPYRSLRRALSAYRAIAAAGAFVEVPAGKTLKPGDDDPRVAEIRSRLRQSDDLVAANDPAPPTVYSPNLVQSMMRFQRRHGLDPDGIVGKNTIAELNVPVAARIAQIVISMERWRWMPDDLGNRYILVNIVGFDLKIIEDGHIFMEMPVVVGRPFRRTPVFSGMMTYMEFSPTWTVPPTIVKEDVIPKARQDSGYIETKGLRIYDGWDEHAAQLDPKNIDWHGGMSRLMSYRYIQPPGPNNALGRVKFMFPNPYSIYLHDTPERGGFGRASRAFSSGCIRVERPRDLALYLLRDSTSWSAADVDKAMQQPVPARVVLPEPIPVFLTYATAWVGEGGTIEFRPDIYGRDTSLREAIAGSQL